MVLSQLIQEELETITKTPKQIASLVGQISNARSEF